MKVKGDPFSPFTYELTDLGNFSSRTDQEKTINLRGRGKMGQTNIFLFKNSLLLQSYSVCNHI